MTGSTLLRADIARIVGNDQRSIRAFESLLSMVFEGVTAVVNGGTGLSDLPANGELLIGNNGAYELGFLQSGGNITVSVGPGSVTIEVTSLDAGLIDSGTLDEARLPAFTGDATSPIGSSELTLATVNSDVGSYGAADETLVVTVDAKGRITAVSAEAIEIDESQVNGLGTMSTQNANAVAITGGTMDDVAIGTTIADSVRGSTVLSVGAFACNGKTLQASASVNAAIAATAGAAYTATEQGMINDLKALVNQLRAALVANGIAV